MPLRCANVGLLAVLVSLAACQQSGNGAGTAADAAAPVATRGPDDSVVTTADVTIADTDTGTASASASASASARPAPAMATAEIDPPTLAPARPAAAAVPAPAAFDPASVPESTAALPRFPLFETPEGLTGLFKDEQRDIAFDREHMIAGDAVVAIEGKVFRQRYRLDGGPRRYSDVEFHRHYAEAIRALDGVEVSTVQFSPPVNAAFGGRAAVDRHYHGTCASHGCENHTWLVRQRGTQYWVLISSGGIPLHGQVTVVEREE